MTRRLPLRGFTLVEVLVALFVMAVLATMAWQGVDAMARTREGAQQASAQMLRLGNVLTQWEQDLNQIQDSAAAPSLRFDGAALRLTRRSPEGLQFVVWTLQDRQLWRWASPPVTRVQDMQDWWIRGQQWSAISGDALRMLGDVEGWQVYYWRLQDNTWSNAQSTGDVAPVAPPPVQPGEEPPPPPEFDRELLPRGVRLQLQMPPGLMTRDIVLRP
ncbi:MAG: prepilin-type N-terminal cleavage/methylation domain-containing protein [Burkholderiales bacterium]|nr:prepilin-type N-terminal cleavage/methylation domain-containing protein [Burkholderiales bacterium]